jgi:hypothetical protein
MPLSCATGSLKIKINNHFFGGSMKGLKGAWLAAIVCGILAASCIWLGLQSDKLAADLKDHSKQAVATVEKVQWKEKALSGTEKKFTIDVSFQTENKEKVLVNLSVSSDVGKSIRDNDQKTVNVVYLPESPEKARLADDKEDDGSYSYLFALVFIALGAYRLFKGYKDAKVATAA